MAVRVTSAPIAIAFTGDRARVTSILLNVAFVPAVVPYVRVQIFFLN